MIDIDLPDIDLKSPSRFADWVELAALLSRDGKVSRIDVIDVLQGAGVLGGRVTDYGDPDEACADDTMIADGEAAERFVELVWEHLWIRHGRELELPLEYGLNTVSRKVGSWHESVCFTALVLMTNVRGYKDCLVEYCNGISFRTLFERIVLASHRGLFRGACFRFGWPVEPGLSADSVTRITEMADALQVVPGILDNVTTDPNDKDLGLDVVGRLRLGSDDGPGTLTVITQCATGENWDTKIAEPVLARWRDLLRWDSVLVRSLALPWPIDDNKEFARVHRRFGAAVILDRTRLMAGQPDTHIGLDTRVQIESWCVAQLSSLPVLRP